MARIVFMGTPQFAVPGLEALIETQQVVGVVTQPDRPAGRGGGLRPPAVKLAAQAAGIPVYQPDSLRSEASAEPLAAWQPDLIVVAAFGQILRPHVLYLAPHGSLNVHASLLPRWRGASPIQHALLSGDAETGVTLMQMDEGLDTGPMYLQESLAVDPRETASTLHDKLAELGAELLRCHLDDILEGRYKPRPQDDEASTYAPLIKKDNGRLDWHNDALTLDRLVRAMNPWPGAFTLWDGRVLKILEAEPHESNAGNAVPGQVLAMPQGWAVQTGDGRLLLKRVKLAGKRAMTAETFGRGQSQFAGSILGE